MRRSSSLRRREDRRTSKRRFVIYCEGENTEPQYLEALRRQMKGAIIDIEIVRGAGVPATISTLATESLAGIRSAGRRSKQSFDKADQVWAVFDEDAHPGVKQAINLCRSAGVGVAYSNPCFEIWLVLHLESFDKLLDRHQMQKHLQALCPEYDPKSGKTPDCDELVKAVDQAELRAAAQQQKRIDEGSPMGVPSTTVYQLTIALRDAHAGFADADAA